MSLRELAIRYLPIGELKENPRNARTHSKKQILEISRSIKEFGFNNPVLLDKENTIVAGHGRKEAAKLLGFSTLPTIQLENLTQDQIRAYILADNRLAQNAGWDESILAIELQHLMATDIGFDIAITGFAAPEIDLILQADKHNSDHEEIAETPAGPRVTQAGQLWQMGKHRVLCGNSLDKSTFIQLMGKRCADMVFTDPPYNVPIDGNVCGNGSIHHPEFVMASGELSEEQFIVFLTASLRLLSWFSKPGSVHFICMDWRHLKELSDAGQRVYAELLNLCVWVKNNGGMGSLYRSQHELVFVFKNEKAPHRNNIRLGKYGRNRTNVWEYPGVNTLSKGEEGNLLALHPTVKPVSLVADAILDCSARGDMVLDAFLGSGTTLLAAERVGRVCHAIEIDPGYVDVAIRRWQKLTGEHAIDFASGRRFDEIGDQKADEENA
jgi:DNA modification methylase